jgi:hypothetical protein
MEESKERKGGEGTAEELRACQRGFKWQSVVSAT